MGGAEFITSITEGSLADAQKAESFLQSAAWGAFKARFGWGSRVFLIDFAPPPPPESEAPPSCPLLALFRRLAPGVSFVYVPWGPENFGFAGGNQGPLLAELALAELARKLRPFFPPTAAFIRFDIPWFAEAQNARPVFSPPFKKSPADIQAPDTVLVDLTGSEPQILSNMKPKWRYNIGLAEKRGVKIARCDAGEITEGDIDVFYNLLCTTALRDGIAIHGKNYYKTLFDVFSGGGARGGDARLSLYTASFEGKAIAAIVVLCRGKNAVYLYGASGGEHRNLMPAYALQWRAMRDAKDRGCQRYDLFGIPPACDPAHPMAGLYRFKTGFGGRVIHRAGCWDYPYKSALYAIFRMAESGRKKLRDLKKKKLEAAPKTTP